MKTAFILVTFLILVAVNSAMACSVYVDNNAQKTILKNLAASYLDLAPASITSLSISGYSKLFGDENPESLCPESLTTQAKVAFAYKPNAKTKCNAQVTVARSVYIGEDPTISYENVEMTDSSASCSTVSSRLSRPVRPTRPVRVPPVRPVRP